MSEPVVVTADVLRGWPLPSPDDDAGKDSRGGVLILGGATDTPGAVLLAGLAALRVGAGRLTMATVEPTAVSLAVAVPESAVHALPATRGGTLGAAAGAAAAELVDDADAIVIGPGLRDPDGSRDFVAAVLDAAGERAVVVDAMALTCGAFDAGPKHANVVATPNLTEAAFLLDREPRDDAQAAGELAESTGAVVALRSRITAPDGREWIEKGGNSGLGTSGSGDVLAGAIGGLLARGADPAQAAVWGAHLHAHAGERLSARIGALGYLARELLDELPQILARLTP
jgi:ADP-dependent NAD(P)H-hydrate dehydratase